MHPKKKKEKEEEEEEEKEESKQRKFHKVKVTSPFLLNKIMAHQLQNSRGRLVLQLTIEQPRQACFKAS